ncbi:hypothetical protein AAC387_Pa08g0840 [Persea americana]
MLFWFLERMMPAAKGGGRSEKVEPFWTRALWAREDEGVGVDVKEDDGAVLEAELAEGGPDVGEGVG